MFSNPRVLRHFSAIFLACSLIVACSSSSPESTADDPNEIELTEGKVAFVKGTKSYTCKVKYRFTKGKPRAERWYIAQCTLGGASGGVAILVEKQGKELEPQGELSAEVLAIKTGLKDYEMEMLGAIGKGGYRPASNKLPGKIE